MDGFDLEVGAYSKAGQNLAYTQFAESQIPNYWAYARTYALADNMFADWKGASFANGLFNVAAQAGGYDSSIGNRSVNNNPISAADPNLSRYGCDSPPDTQTGMLAANGTLTALFPCFRFNSLPQELSANKVSWRQYADQGAKSFVHVGIDALAPVRYSPLWNNLRPLAQFSKDAAAGTLPAVSWVEGIQTEHPIHTACDGENESVGLINSVMNGPDWASTAIFVSWDEWGGFYDHVAPPQLNNVSYGFRVPLLAISPWTKLGSTPGGGGSISHTFYSFASILRFIEDDWALPTLTPQDGGAKNLMDMFDFSSAQRPALLLQTRTCTALSTQQQQQWAAETRHGDD
jgi:phospholipase C